MNVLITTIVFNSREVKVDNMHDIANVETSRRDTSSDEDRALASAERAPEET
jgi:hypothetical protein